MRKTFLTGFILICSMLTSALAFEGKLVYRVNTDDIEWSMECYVNGSQFKAEIYYEGTHFHSLVRNTEGVLIVNEQSKQAALAYKAEQRWGQDKSRKLKMAKLPEPTMITTPDGKTAKEYRIREKGKSFVVEILEGYGSIPGILFDQFSQLRPLGEYGYPMFEQQTGVPNRIYYKKKAKSPILELVDVLETKVDASVFVIPSDYHRTKLQLSN
jgi:hypothetical protein